MEYITEKEANIILPIYPNYKIDINNSSWKKESVLMVNIKSFIKIHGYYIVFEKAMEYNGYFNRKLLKIILRDYDTDKKRLIRYFKIERYLRDFEGKKEIYKIIK